MTETSSHTSATMPKSWVIISIAMLYLRFRSFISSSTCA